MASSSGSDERLPIVVVGGGLTGAAIALQMVQMGFKVLLLERRPDLRLELADEEVHDHLGRSTDANKRSINLALSVRGQEAMKSLGVLQKVMKHAIAMKCRAIHSADGKSMSFQPYGTHGECIYSISRQLLNRVLLDAVEDASAYTGAIQLMFDTKFLSVNRDNKVTYKPASGETRTVSARLVIGADGAYSGVRSSMLRLGRFNFSQSFIEHGYKELEIPASDSGEFRMECINALHIWPRHEFMMIALPNPDKTWTCTLFAPFKTFEELDASTDDAIVKFFEDNFPDAVPLLPDIVSQYRTNPTGALATMNVKPWNYKSQVVLMGDAAHAIVPFYGQGMNAGLEDTLVFREVYEECGMDLERAVVAFAEKRKPAGDAIATLSQRNYSEMRSHTASRMFLLRKSVEGVLHKIFPTWWIPQYTMVSFTRIPYDEALERADRQNRIVGAASKSFLLAALGVAAGAGAVLLNRRGLLPARLSWSK